MKVTTDLFPRLGLLKTFSELFRRHMRALCVENVGSGRLKSSLTRRVLEVGRVVGLGRVREDTEF